MDKREKNNRALTRSYYMQTNRTEAETVTKPVASELPKCCKLIEHALPSLHHTVFSPKQAFYPEQQHGSQTFHQSQNYHSDHRGQVSS
jgi:hypothetical protein